MTSLINSTSKDAELPNFLLNTFLKLVHYNKNSPFHEDTVTNTHFVHWTSTPLLPERTWTASFSYKSNSYNVHACNSLSYSNEYPVYVFWLKHAQYRH